MERYTKNGLMIKVNSDMSYTSGLTRVDWANLSGSSIVGGLFRLGKIFGVAIPQTYESDSFMDLSEKTNRVALINNKKLAIGYIEVDPDCWLNRGWTEDSVDSLMDGTISEVAEKLIKYEPHLYLLARKTKQGAGRVFTASKLKDLPDWDADGWCWLLNKYWRSDNSILGDFWTGKTLRLLNYAKFLSENGYLPKQADTQMVETSEWFLFNYGNSATRDAVAGWDSIPQGNYWKEKNVGLYNCNTTDELITLINKIPDDFQIENVGAGVPGKIVVGYKLTSNIIMPQILNASGTKVPFDVISFKITNQDILNRYPKYAKRLSEVIPPPVEPPPPPPIVKKKYFIPNVARNARIIPSTENNTAVGALITDSKVLVDAEADGSGYHWIQTKIWVATNYGSKYYGKFVEE
jgi:hypothetical protein